MTDVSLRIKVDSSETDKGKRSLDELANAGAKAEGSSKKLTEQTDRVAGAAKAAAAAFTALAGSMAVREVIRYADEWQNAENRLKLVTSSSAELARVQGVLMKTANETRAGFSSTAELYTTLSRSTTALGLSTEDLVGITRTINQTFAVAGASAQGMEGAIRQLSQGLASGALRGDEFNSVAEQAPGIMDALAASLKMSRGELREFAATGGITSEILVNALQQYADTAEGMAATATRTFGQSMTEARNNMLEFIGSSEAVKASVSGMGSTLVALSGNLETLGNVAAVAAIAYGSKMAGAAATSTAAFIASTAAASASMAAEVARTQALVVSTGAEAARTAALIAGNSALFTNASATAAAQAAQIAHTQAVAANASAVTAATAANGAWRASLMALFGPGAIIGVAAGAMYLMVQQQKDSADAAWEQARAFEAVLAKLGELTEQELVRQAVVLNGEIETTRNRIIELERLTGKYGTQTEEIRKLNVQLKAQESNQKTVIDQLRRVQDGWKPATAAVKENTSAVVESISNAEYLTEVYRTQTGAIGITADEYLRLMGVAEDAGTAQVVAAEAASAALTGLGSTNVVVTQDMQRRWDQTHNYLSGAFVDLMNEGGNAWDNIGKGFERMVQRMVAEWAASGLMSMFGMGSPSAPGVGTTAVNALFNGGSLMTGASNAAGLVSGAASVFGSSGAVISAAEYAQLMGGASVGAGGAGGAGIAAGIKGVAAAIPVWGWAAMAAAVAAKLLVKESTPSFNAGMFLGGPMGHAGEFAVDPFESGVAVTGYTRRADQSDATTSIDTFRTVDAAVMAVMRAAGITDFRADASQLQGLDERGMGTGRFLGLAGEDGKPGATMDSQLTQYAQGLIGQAYAQGKIDASTYELLANAGDYLAIIEQGKKLIPELEAATEKYTDEQQRLMDRLFPLQAQTKRYESDLQMLQTIFVQGSGEYESAVDRLKAAYKDLFEDANATKSQYTAQQIKMMSGLGMNPDGSRISSPSIAPTPAVLEPALAASMNLPTPATLSSEVASNNAAMINELRNVRTELMTVSRATNRTADLLMSVTRDGESLVTTAA